LGGLTGTFAFPVAITAESGLLPVSQIKRWQ